MLHFLRRAVKSIVAKVLLGLLILSFAVWGIGDIFVGGGGGTVARVGDTEISAERLARAIQRQRNQMMRERGELVTLEALRAARIDRRELAAMLADATYEEELAKLDVVVPPESVRQAIRANEAFQDGQGGFSQYTYQTTLNEYGYGPGEFEQLTRAFLGRQILEDAIAPAVAAPPGAAALLAAWQGETRSVRAVTLPAEAAPDPGEPDDETLAAWFEANSAAFVEPERRWGRYFRISMAALAAELAPTSEEVRAEYDANPDAFTVEPSRTVEQIVFPDRAAAEDAARRIDEGAASFVEIAAEQNLGPDDIALGTVGRNELAAASADAVFALTEPGIAGPVEGPFGFALLNVTDVVVGGLLPFEMVEGEVTAAIARRRAQEAALTRANRIDDLRAQGMALEQIATETGLELMALNGIDPRGVPLEGPPPAALADQRFLREVASAIDGEERDVIPMTDGGYALVMIDRIVDSHLPELADIRDRVVAAWKLDRRLAALEDRITTAIADGTVDLGALAAEAGTETREIAGFTRVTPPRSFSPALVEAIFAAREGSAAVGRGSDGQTVIVARVATVTPLAGEALAAETERLEAVLSEGVARDQFNFYSEALRLRHDARISEETIDRVFEQLGQTGG